MSFQKKSAAELLRDKYMSSHLKKVATEKAFPNLEEIYGIDYLMDEVQNKIYNPLFNAEKYLSIGCKPAKSLLIRGVDGVGKSFIVKTFCQHFTIPLISTTFCSEAKDIKDLFSKSKSTEKSIILIKNLDHILNEPQLRIQLKECIDSIDWCCLVIMTNTTIPENFSVDNEIFVKIPNTLERKAILDGILKNMKVYNVDTWLVSQNIPGFVPRDIVKLISMCATRAVARISEKTVPLLKKMSIGTESYSEQNHEEPFITMEDFSDCISNWKNIYVNITFDDIGALDKVKAELYSSILLPSKYPERFAAFGITKPSGILLYGPPGCGKTLIAKAVSNMSHCNFLSIKGPELITKYVGDSEKHLRDLFQKAKNLSPCVLFFDEIDSLCSKRGKNEFGNRIVNQILTLLDGMEDRGEVYLIGATNRIESIDSALLRPGRFDKLIEVSLPDNMEAIEIFKKCISKLPCDIIDPGNFDFTGFSGADISGIVKEAAIMCLQDNFENENAKITEIYFKNAVDKMRNMKNISNKRNK